jgi:hypothetical protein
MTALIGVLVAWLAPNTRAVVATVVILMTVGTAIQTWDLASGWGSQPADTVNASYWAVQLVIVSIVLCLALGLFRLRALRANRQGRSLARPAFTGRQGLRALLASVLALTVVGFVVCLIGHTTARHPGRGAGQVPWTGLLGMVLGLVAVAAVLSILFLRLTADRAPTTARHEL